MSVNWSGSFEVRLAKLFLVAADRQRALSALDGADTEVMRALGADVEGRLEILVVDQLRAARTLDPEALRHAAGFSAVEDAIRFRSS